MAYRIFWTPIAVQDLRDICNFISRDNLVAAQRIGEELIKQSEAMAAFPMSGRMVPEKKDPLIRETLVGSYRIIMPETGDSRHPSSLHRLLSPGEVPRYRRV